MQKQNTDPVADKAAAELLTAVKALNASSHFEEVKRRIEAADKTVITPETEFELVRAFIGQYGFSADPQVQQAREGFKVMLAQYLESHGDDPYWLLLVGLLHAGSPGESGLALDFLDSALSRSTSGNPLFMDTPAITAVRNRAADLLSQPYRAGRDFAGATKNFWERFQERAGDYAQIIGRTGDVDPVLFQNIEDELNSSLGQVIIGAHARLECSRENGHTEVIVRLLPGLYGRIPLK